MARKTYGSQAPRELSWVMEQLHENARPDRIAGMERFGIVASNALGLSMPFLRDLAKKIQKSHALAQELWDTGFHEARILASLIYEPQKLSADQIRNWVSQFHSWDICDQVILNLFVKFPDLPNLCLELCKLPSGYQKRAGYVSMAVMAVHRKELPDQAFFIYKFPLMDGASDPDPFVQKAVSWALRQIGKRNPELKTFAINTAKQLLRNGQRGATWVARDVLRELESRP
jgi:3-methyladenine DNA glycosylase AlkD